MMESAGIINDLERELEQMQESFLAEICDCCRFPFEMDQEQLEAKCETCKMESNLKGIIKKQNTANAGKIMKIVAEEMHAVKI